MFIYLQQLFYDVFNTFSHGHIIAVISAMILGLIAGSRIWFDALSDYASWFTTTIMSSISCALSLLAYEFIYPHVNYSGYLQIIFIILILIFPIFIMAGIYKIFGKFRYFSLVFTLILVSITSVVSGFATAKVIYYYQGFEQSIYGDKGEKLDERRTEEDNLLK